MIARLATCLVFWASVVGAQTLDFPSNARMMAERTSPLDSYAMPVSAWVDGSVTTDTGEGALQQQAWRIAASGLTSLQLIRPLREQLRNDGFTVIFECADRDCGGFDFRFSTDVMPPPNMQVNLGDFRYLAAKRDDTRISLIASRTAQAGYVQVTRIGTESVELAEPKANALRAVAPSIGNTDFAAALGVNGRATLQGLVFETGSSQLGAGPFEALQDLADYLVSIPDQRVALVGHTDSSGSLDGNIRLSKRRAGSVLERLVSNYGVPRRQLDAQGMGYLAPAATNLTEEGRETNRRVEVIITSTAP